MSSWRVVRRVEGRSLFWEYKKSNSTRPRPLGVGRRVVVLTGSAQPLPLRAQPQNPPATGTQNSLLLAIKGSFLLHYI